MEKTLGIPEHPPEWRQFPRLKVSVPIQFRSVLKPHDPFAGSLSKDLSAGGVRLTSPTFLPKEARLVVVLSLPNARQVRAIGRVAWVKGQSLSETYDSGIQFIEIESEDQRMIKEYVE